MSFGKLAGLYLITTVAFFAFDFVWLSTATKRIYQPYLGDLLLEKPNLPVAAVFYLFYIVGLIALAIIPGLREASIVGALWRGRPLWRDRVRDLRPHEPRHAERVGVADLGDRHRVGHDPEHGCGRSRVLRGNVARHQVARAARRRRSP